MNSEEVRVGNREKEVLLTAELGLGEAEPNSVHWALTVHRCAQYLGAQSHWDAGEERWGEGRRHDGGAERRGPRKPFPNCEHLSSCKTQILILDLAGGCVGRGSVGVGGGGQHVINSWPLLSGMPVMC